MRQLSVNPDALLLTLDRPYDFVSPFGGDEYALLLVSYDPLIGESMMNDLSDAIVAGGCRYACCAGWHCSAWDTAIDFAFLRTDTNFDPPDDRFVMTTWHENEPLSEAVWFFRNCTSFEEFTPSRFLIVLLSADATQEEEAAGAVRAHFPAHP